MIYTIIALLLISGCAADNTYDPKTWPRAIVTTGSLEDPVEVERVERIRRAVDIINKRVGAGVYQVAVTDKLESAPCDTIAMEYVDVVVNNLGDPTDNYLGMHSLYLMPCRSYIQLDLDDNDDPTDGRHDADVSTIVHELMHNLLGHEHDEDGKTEPRSVFRRGGGCLAADPEVGYEEPEYCARRYTVYITQSLVDRIRAKMGLPPDPEPAP